MKYKIGVVSLGCSKNLVDTEVMLGILKENDFEITNDEKSADIIIVNTCSFIDSAKQESIDNIIELAQYKRNGVLKLLVVTGCLAERYKEEILNELPEVDAVIGTGNYHEINILIKQALKGEKIIRTGSPDYTPPEGLPRIQSTPSYTAYIKIADGCDNCCTYCVIPKIRGKYRSRKIEDIVKEAESLASSGVKELVVIAQDTSSYGIDLYGEYILAKLLDKLCGIEGIKWIRLHYLYPEHMTEELIDTIANQPKILKYFDIPIQHSNNYILKRMGRKVSHESLSKLINDIREKIPEAVFRTSIIVGFPAESDEHFKDLESFIKRIRFDRLGVFTYSREEGTPAAEFDAQVDDNIKEIRQQRLMQVQSEISKSINFHKNGKIFEVLIEGYDREKNIYYGRTYADSIDIDGNVFIDYNTEREQDLIPGDFVKVKINNIGDYDLMGVLVDELSE